MKFDSPALLESIKRYAQSQRMLLDLLQDAHPSADFRWMFGFPRRGSVVDHEAREWKYQLHGAGVRFVNPEGLVIDADRCLDQDWEAFDAFRIEVYLSSLGYACLDWEGETLPLEYSTVQTMLNHFLLKGSVTSAGYGNLYVLA